MINLKIIFFQEISPHLYDMRNIMLYEIPYRILELRSHLAASILSPSLSLKALTHTIIQLKRN